LRPASLALYALATGLAEPLAPTILRHRAARGKEDPARLAERLGRAGLPRPEGRLVWLHGVSVGESVSLLPLASALQGEGFKVLVTSGTRTSAELLARRLPPGAIHQYAPVDGPAAVARFLDHWRPDLGVFVESELWPNMIQAAGARGVKLALVSARMTQASADGWRRAPGAARRLLQAFDLVLPQEAETEARLAALGAVAGPQVNLKRVGDPPPHDPAELAGLKTALAGRRAILAASTHAGEDEIVAGAVKPTGAVLVVAPRHPERGAAVAEGLKALGFDVARRGAGEALGPGTTAYVIDTLGEMGLAYRLADVVVMGGSFVTGIGGHNPLEPARLGATVVTGPHVFNNAAPYGEMFAEVAAIEAPDAAALRRHLTGLLTQPLIARRIGEAALTYAQRQGEVLDQTLRLLRPLLPA
jgi:3-deoxy-D-manno-octulosonic-acid transferase